MVMPGEAATTPPVVTTPGMPPAVSPAVPVTPVPGQPAPLIAPPPVAPKQEEFHPPGGSYLYHQSSNDRPLDDSAGTDTKVKLAAAQLPEASTLRFQAADEAPAPPGSVEQAVYRDDKFAISNGAARQGSSLKFQQKTGGIRGDPPQSPTTLAAGRTVGGGTVRFVGEPVANVAHDEDAPTASVVLRMTASQTDPEGIASQGNTEGAETSRIAIVPSSTATRTSAAVDDGRGAVTQTAFQSAPTSDYNDPHD